MFLIVNSKFLIIFCGHIFRHSRTFSKSPQKFIPTSLLPENQYSILNYSAWRKWRLWRNGGEVSATSATFATCHFYISREYIFLKKVFECKFLFENEFAVGIVRATILPISQNKSTTTTRTNTVVYFQLAFSLIITNLSIMA